ncbi:MAG: cyclic 2,3-diphosphoglycerate synthetase [Actinomycetota bacterium]|nr:cyclic 2,3-diphosphoglycerate synthetase [Actinomycetota bacterium]
MRVLVLIDGEHYPPVTRWGIDTVRAQGHEVLGALMLGGREKVREADPLDLGVPTQAAGHDVFTALAESIERERPDGVVDLSDEPVVGYRERMRLAAVALARGAVYLGADFRLDPPITEPALPVPTVAVIGTGKRTGKTAIGGEVARVAATMGLAPIVVAMGRGGPPEPQVAEAGSVGMQQLLELARAGEHAASDYLEDAVTTGVTTVGARRCGGGLAGGPYASNVGEAARLAASRSPGIVILEGSGASIPPVPWDAGILVVPASLPEEYLGGYLGPFRLLLSDLVVFTMTGSPDAGPENLPALRSHAKRIRPHVELSVTDFEPVPLQDVRGRVVFFTTTAPEQVAEKQAERLGTIAGCRVVGWSSHLADRKRLEEDMDNTESYDVLLTELKAAAVDVACERALARGAEVVFVDNRASTGKQELQNSIRATLVSAQERYATR